jgi:midasin
MTTSTPGKFKWQPGVLTSAVTEGRWILFEDIDLAPVDVTAVLLPLLETGWLHIPRYLSNPIDNSRGERHQAKEGFRIFGTRKASKATTMETGGVGDNLWVKLFISEIPKEEIESILSTRFPTVQFLLSSLLQVYFNLVNQYPAGAGRQISVRDLIKWCDRVSKWQSLGRASDNETKELLFLEAYDCFVAMLALESNRLLLSQHLAGSLGIHEHRLEFFLNHYIPAVQINDSSVEYGRTVLSRLSSKTDDNSPFANTSLSIKHLERISVAVAMNEPVLLVGETGTGKTTIVQRLASQLGRKLTVMNMSQQSDSTDLLGGFKPIDGLMLAAPLRERFEVLFSATFSVTQNGPFLESIKKTFKKKKWDQLVVGLRNACGMAKKVAQLQKKEQGGEENPKKIRKMVDPSIFIQWESFEVAVEQFKAQIRQIQTNFLFSFVEGTLIQAIKNGEWILLDEINLATAESLECLSSLLQSSDGSILLLERGTVETFNFLRRYNFHPATSRLSIICLHESSE